MFIIKVYFFNTEECETSSEVTISNAARSFLTNLISGHRKVEVYEELNSTDTRLIAFASRMRNDEPFLVKIVFNIF